MPEHIRAFVVVITVAVLCFAILAKPAQTIIGATDYRRWRNLWLAVTSVAFLVGNFWIFAVLSGLLVLIAQQRESSKAALYWLLLCVIPLASRQIPGFGLIDHLFALNNPRLLALLLLVPLLLFGQGNKSKKSRPMGSADMFIILYVLLASILSFRGTTGTDAIRFSVLMCLDVLVPYLAFSRSLRNIDDIKRTMLAFLIPLLVFAMLGAFEFLKHWKLYVIPGLAEGSSYLGREGMLRATVTAGNSIVLGYTMMIGIGLLLPFADRYLSRGQSIMAFGALALGLISSLSRGPWVGTAILLVTYILTGRHAIKKLAYYGMMSLMSLPFFMLTPYWQKIVNLLPFIGSVESANISYRERLIENAWIVIQRHPWVGSTDYRSTAEMQSMIQGQGIIDIVNSYIGVALNHGLVGLFLFVTFFYVVLRNLNRAYRGLPEHEHEAREIGRALFATLIAILVTIGTVSSISFIPFMYWTVAGLAVAYIRVVHARKRKEQGRRQPAGVMA